MQLSFVCMYVVVAEQAHPFRPNLFISQLFSPAAYKLSTYYDHHSILYRIWTVNPSGLTLGRVSCVQSGQQLKVGLSPTVGAFYFGNKNWLQSIFTPLGSAYLFPSLHLFCYQVTHAIIGACPHHLSCCIVYILHLFLYFLALLSPHLTLQSMSV